MRLKSIFQTLPLTIATLFLAAGCNGPSDDSTATIPENATYAVTLSYHSFVNGQCDSATEQREFATNERFCAVANVTADNTDVANVLVDFSSDNADITPSTTLTDSHGNATAVVSSANQTAIAGTLTASYTPSSGEAVSDSRTYEFKTTEALPPAANYTLTTSIANATGVVTRFKVDEAVQLQAQFVDANNQGIADQLVTFQAGNATLTPATSLTDDQGMASVPYTATESELGATTLVATINYQNETFSGNSFYEVRAADEVTPEGTLKIGHFSSDGKFVEGVLGTTLTTDNDGNHTISAGGSFGVTATIVTDDNNGNITRLQTPATVNFSSDCSSNNLASLDSPVTTLSGTASSTFSDTTCSGNSEHNDQIIASTSIGGINLNANFDFTLARQTLSNLSFMSADPTQIRIKGAGGTGSSESSLVTFLVTSANGQPAAQQTVDFTLDTVIGGLSFANGQETAQSITTAQGIASVRVQSGTVPTPVRVVATATDPDTNETVSSQSEQLTVNTGLPQQLGFTISPSIFNPEADRYNAEKVVVSVYASDSFGNPAPDDTTINFTAEGGQIQPSCLTQGGTCSVTWTSTDPRVSNHRVTILAYALGHETFFDTDGDNMFTDADGNAITEACLDNAGNATKCTGNGMDIETYHSNGFSDLANAYRDDNESGSHDSGEPFFNTSGENSYQVADSLFNGPQCDGALCGEAQANKTYIRSAFVLTMSGSKAVFALQQDGNAIGNPKTDINNIAANGNSNFQVNLTDGANQMLPNGSTVSITATAGALIYDNFVVGNATREGGSNVSFSLKNDGNSGVSTVNITVTTPKGVISQFSFNVTLL